MLLALDLYFSKDEIPIYVHLTFVLIPILFVILFGVRRVHDFMDRILLRQANYQDGAAEEKLLDGKKWSCKNSKDNFIDCLVDDS